MSLSDIVAIKAGYDHMTSWDGSPLNKQTNGFIRVTEHLPRAMHSGMWQRDFLAQACSGTVSVAAPPVLTAVSVLEFEEAAELLSADPGASTLSMSNPLAAAGDGEDVKLDLSEDEEGQEESSEVCPGHVGTWVTMTRFSPVLMCASSC